MKEFIVKLCLLVCFIFCFEGCLNKKNQHVEYIAHACSEIDGHRYTNCKEALEQAIEYGLRYIEIDWDLTSDSILVATHGWEQYHYMVGDAELEQRAVSYEEFCLAKYFGKYSPLTYKDVLSIWEKNPHLILVTDKISDPSIITKFLSPLKNRMLVECFSVDDYDKLKSLGYDAWMSEYPITKKMRIKRWLKLDFHDWNRDYVFHGTIDGKKGKYRNNVGHRYALYVTDRSVSIEDADNMAKIDNRIAYVYVDLVKK